MVRLDGGEKLIAAGAARYTCIEKRSTGFDRTVIVGQKRW
jgi:hypothetical protein